MELPFELEVPGGGVWRTAAPYIAIERRAQFRTQSGGQARLAWQEARLLFRLQPLPVRESTGAP